LLNVKFRLVPVNPVIASIRVDGYKYGDLIATNYLKGKKIFSIVDKTESIERARFIAMITDKDQNKIIPPINMNVFPYYVKDQFNRDVKNLKIFINLKFFIKFLLGNL